MKKRGTYGALVKRFTTRGFQSRGGGSIPPGVTLSINETCCLDRVGKVSGRKPEVIRKDGQVRILQAALSMKNRPQSLNGGAPALKAGNRKRRAGSNPVCGAQIKTSRLGGEATRRFRKPRPPERTRRFDPSRRRFMRTWPSGRWRLPAKEMVGKPTRRFESFCPRSTLP